MMDVLGLRGKKFQQSTFCGSEFLQVVKAMFKKCDRDEFTMFVGTSKKIWFNHNTVVRRGGLSPECHPNNLVRGAMESTSECKKANLTEPILPKENRGGIQIIWKVLLAGISMVN